MALILAPIGFGSAGVLHVWGVRDTAGLPPQPVARAGAHGRDASLAHPGDDPLDVMMMMMMMMMMVMMMVITTTMMMMMMMMIIIIMMIVLGVQEMPSPPPDDSSRPQSMRQQVRP
jgi:hypothetical protein